MYNVHGRSIIQWLSDVLITVMKRILSLSLCWSILLISQTGCQSVQQDSQVDSDIDWVFDWDELESRIIELTNEALRDENAAKLYSLKWRLAEVQTGADDHRSSSREYWTAVLNTNLIFFEQEHGESTQVHSLIDESIELLEQSNYPIVETNALLAILYRAKIDYDEEQTFELFSKMQDALDVAIDVDPANLRVLLAQVFIGVQPVLGFSIDLDIQNSIDTALTSKYETVGDAMTPTWGLPELYGFAIGHLLEVDKLNEAYELTAQAIDRFPDDITLKYFARLFQVENNRVEP